MRGALKLPLPKKSGAAKTPQDLVPDRDKSGPDAKFANQDYNKVARSANLEKILLVASSFLLRPKYFEPKDSKKENREFSYKAEFGEFSFREPDGIASCQWKWSLDAKRSGKPLISIQAHYLIAYSRLSGCNEEAVARFMTRVSRFATYPYFRAHVSQISWESSAELPLLPTIAS